MPERALEEAEVWIVFWEHRAEDAEAEADRYAEITQKKGVEITELKAALARAGELHLELRLTRIEEKRDERPRCSVTYATK